MDTVAQQISLLKISTPPFETVYINDRRVHDHFLGQLGAIKEMVWNAQRRGGGKASFNLFGAGIEGGGELGSEREISFDLTDPVGRALVLRYGLDERRLILSANDAAVGQFVQISGAVQLQHGTEVIRGENFDVEDQRIDHLEREREECESIDLLLGGASAKMWLAVLAEDGKPAGAAVLSDEGIRSGPVGSYRDWPWKIFGTLRQRFDGIPLITAVHAWVDLSQAR